MKGKGLKEMIPFLIAFFFGSCCFLIRHLLKVKAFFFGHHGPISSESCFVGTYLYNGFL